MKTIKKFLFCLALTNITAAHAIDAESYAEKSQILKNSYAGPYALSLLALIGGAATMGTTYIKSLHQEVAEAKALLQKIPFHPPKSVLRDANRTLYAKTLQNIGFHACLVGIAGTLHSLLLRNWLQQALPAEPDTKTLLSLDKYDVSQELYTSLAAFSLAATYSALCQYYTDKKEYYESLAEEITPEIVTSHTLE